MFGAPLAQTAAKASSLISNSEHKEESSKMSEEEKSSIASYGVAIISVSAKIPEFWVDMPRLWFIQFESVMAPQKQGLS